MSLLNEYEKVELMVSSVGDCIGGQHFEAADLLIKRLVQVSGEFKAKLLPPDPKDIKEPAEAQPEITGTVSPESPMPSGEVEAKPEEPTGAL